MTAPFQPAPHDPDAHLRRRPPSNLPATVLAIVCAALAILWQNLPEQTQRALVGKPPVAPDLSTGLSPVSQVGIMGPLFFKLSSLDPNMAQYIPMLESSSMDLQDKVATAVYAAEFISAEKALEHLDKVETEAGALANNPPPDADPADIKRLETIALDVQRDIDALRVVYTDAPDALDQTERDRLVDRYHKTGKIALVFDKPNTDPARAQLLSGAWGIVLYGLAILVVGGLAFLAGFVLLILGIIRLGSGKLRFAYRPDPPPTPVFLELYALFVGAFFVYVVAMTATEPPALTMLGIQWVLLLVPFWPLARGMDGRAFRQAIGLHTGAGLFREIGAGVCVYLATLPIYAVAVVVTMLMLIIKEAISPSGAPPTNPIIDIAGGADPAVLAMVFLLATVWAPIVEELVFRGALHRHLRPRLHWIGVGLVTALLFAFMHSYGPLLVLPLVTLGFMFSFMREWRGSIIAPMTAHFVHNFTSMTVVIVGARFLM